MKKNHLRLLFSALLTLQIFAVFGQVEGRRITEEEAADQNTFIEADAALFLGDYEVAIKKYKALFIKDRSNDAIAYNLSRAYLSMSDMDSAEKYIKSAMKLAPENKWYKLLHANMMRDEGRHEEALDSYAWLATHEASNRYFVENYAFTLLILERADEAIQLIEKWESKEGVSELFSKKKFEIYDAQGKTDKAAQELDKLARAYPRDTRFLKNLASYLSKEGKRGDAKAVYERILSIEPNNVDAKVSMASLEENSDTNGQIDQVINDPKINLDDKILVLIPLLEKVAITQDSSALRQLLSTTKILENQYPNDPKVMAVRADALFQDSDYEASALLYARTLEKNNKIFPVWENLMHAQYRMGAFEDLQKTAYDAIDYFPNKVSAYYYYSLGAAANGKYGDADGYLAEASMIAGSNPNLKQMVRIGQAYRYFSENKLDKASEILGGIPESSLQGAAVELMGDIAFKKGKKKEALKFWKQAFDLQQDGAIQEKLSTQSL